MARPRASFAAVERASRFRSLMVDCFGSRLGRKFAATFGAFVSRRKLDMGTASLNSVPVSHEKAA